MEICIILRYNNTIGMAKMPVDKNISKKGGD